MYKYLYVILIFIVKFGILVKKAVRQGAMGRFFEEFLNKLASINLYKKLILSYFLLVSFPLLVVGVLSYRITSNTIESNVSRYVSELLQQINDNIDNSITELERMAYIISGDSDIHRILQKDRNRPIAEFLSDDDIMNGKIDTVANLQPNIEGLYIFSYNGEVYRYRGVENSIRPDYTFTSTRWFNTMKTLNEKMLLLPTHVQDQVITPGTPGNVFTYLREIVDPSSKKPAGYLMVDMNTRLFKDILDKVAIRKYQELLIIDNNKTILFHTREEQIHTQFRSKYVSELLKKGRGSMRVSVNNEPMLVTFNTSPYTNWTVISIMPVKLLFKSVTSLEYLVIFTIFFFLLLSVTITIMISYNITKPLSDLQHLMKKAETGQFDVQIPIRVRDEIGELSASFNSMINKINNLIQTVYETKILKKEAELNALQSQINPHFLYNTLQIIDMLAEDEGIEAISEVSRALSRIFRYSINTGKEIVPLSREIEHVRNYVYIQKLRFKDRFEVVYDIDPALYESKIIKLVLQPLVENAIYHGVEKKRGTCIIKLTAVKNENSIELTVEDNGAGMDPAQLDKIRKSLDEEILHAQTDNLNPRSIGLKNVNARIRLYFGESYGITIDSRQHEGTVIRVRFPADSPRLAETGGFEHGTQDIDHR